MKKSILDIQIPTEFTCGDGDSTYLEEMAAVLGEIEEGLDTANDSEQTTKEERAEQASEEQEATQVSEYKDNGEKKTKQEIADEKWAKRMEFMEKSHAGYEKFMGDAQETMTKIAQRVSELTMLVGKLSDIGSYVTLAMDCLEKNKDKIEKNPWYRYIKLTIKKIGLKIKRALLIVKKEVRNAEKELLVAFYNGKCCQAIEAMFMAVMMTLKLLSEMVKKVTAAIQKVIDFLPDPICIGPEGMSFFLTPKSMMSVPMPIVNLQLSIVDFLDMASKKAIEVIESQGDNANAAAKAAYIAQRIANTELTGSVSSDLIPNVVLPDPSKMIKAAISAILNLIPMAKPLPKYEQLNALTNPGYLIFLSTGWCRAGQCAFGMPGMLPGIKPQSVECSMK